MSHPLYYRAQEIGAYGDISGSGLGNLMGAPDKDRAELLVREAVQNSWDARVGNGPVDFELKSFILSERQSFAFDHYVRNPASSEIRPPSRPRVLFVSDRGTRGLAGPVDPRRVSAGRKDFANFVYMIGETKSADEKTGGTYGYGRSCFFQLSSARTILVYSRCEWGGGTESRLIGIAWDKPFRSGLTTFTGRHWWGRSDDEGNVRPVTGSEADAIAAELGFPTYEADECGTSVMVVQPDFGEFAEEDQDVTESERLTAALLWNCWPRMADGSIRASLNWDGKTTAVEPRDEPGLRHFITAWDAAMKEPLAERAPGPLRIQCVPRSKRPAKRLGSLVCNRWAGLPPGQAGPYAPRTKQGALQHIALVRSPGLVVRYREGPQPPDQQQYAGVFVANLEHDDIFARSEPPSHDDWVAKRLDVRWEKTIINLTERGVEGLLRDWLMPVIADGPSASSRTPLGHMSDLLGTILPALEAEGQDGRDGEPPPPPPPRPNPKTPRPRVTSTIVQREPAQGGWLLHLVVENTSEVEAVVWPRVHVLVERGGAEREAPEGAAEPGFRGWLQVDGPEGGTGPTLIAPGEQQEALVFQPDDCVIQLAFEARAP